MQEQRCHCGLPGSYADCCGRFVSGRVQPDTAEQLMRSRYSAFVEQDEAWLLNTWHPATRPSRIRFNAAQRWLGLSVKHREAGRVEDDVGTVEFVARFKLGDKGHRLHETSRFEKIDGRWYYRDGTHH